VGVVLEKPDLVHADRSATVDSHALPLVSSEGAQPALFGTSGFLSPASAGRLRRPSMALSGRDDDQPDAGAAGVLELQDRGSQVGLR
jgi:hypothetical protein